MTSPYMGGRQFFVPPHFNIVPGKFYQGIIEGISQDPKKRPAVIIEYPEEDSFQEDDYFGDEDAKKKDVIEEVANSNMERLGRVEDPNLNFWWDI